MNNDNKLPYYYNIKQMIKGGVIIKKKKNLINKEKNLHYNKRGGIINVLGTIGKE